MLWSLGFPQFFFKGFVGQQFGAKCVHDFLHCVGVIVAERPIVDWYYIAPRVAGHHHADGLSVAVWLHDAFVSYTVLEGDVGVFVVECLVCNLVVVKSVAGLVDEMVKVVLVGHGEEAHDCETSFGHLLYEPRQGCRYNHICVALRQLYLCLVSCVYLHCFCVGCVGLSAYKLSSISYYLNLPVLRLLVFGAIAPFGFFGSFGPCDKGCTVLHLCLFR